jgi:hypothetical protein
MRSKDQILLEANYQYMYGDKSVQGLPKFMFEVSEGYPRLTDEQLLAIKEVVKKTMLEEGQSDTPKKIEMRDEVAGAISLESGVLLSKGLLRRPLANFLYTLFHELAHQMQYKKYKQTIYDMWVNPELNMDKAVEFLSKIEHTADRYALMKCVEFKKQGIITEDPTVGKGFYSKYDKQQWIGYIKMLRKQLEGYSRDEVSEVLYNWMLNRIKPSEVVKNEKV